MRICPLFIVAAPTLVFFAILAHAAEPVTFTGTIAPLVYVNCTTCHRPGGGAPFSLVTYEDVAKRARLIADVTASRYMPPWHAAPGPSKFVGERHLTDDQIRVFSEWVAQGAPQGDPAKLPPLPDFRDGWTLGEPDLILEMPQGFDLPASGPDVFRNFILPTGLSEDKWVRAVEIRPSAQKAVHHALFAYVPRGSMSAREGKDGQPGFGGAMSVGVAPGQAGSGGLGGWAVGGNPMMFPEGVAAPLPKDSEFLLQVHFHLTGKTETERSTIGIYFADGLPTKVTASVELPALFAFGANLDIPAGEANYTIRDSFTLPGDAKVFSAYAHAHYLGKEMHVVATLPDGSELSLLSIPDWDFNWQEFYQYETPVALPKGTRIDSVIGYDNSEANPRNPNSPPKRIQWGMESFDEMGTVGLLLEIVNPADEAVFGEQLRARTQAAIRAGGADGTLQRYLQYQRLQSTQ